MAWYQRKWLFLKKVKEHKGTGVKAGANLVQVLTQRQIFFGNCPSQAIWDFIFFKEIVELMFHSY